MATKFSGWTTPDEFAAEQERLYQKRNRVIAEQMCRDSQRQRGLGLLRFFVYICLGAGIVLGLLYWLLSGILGDW